jgi:hypothetical protein
MREVMLTEKQCCGAKKQCWGTKIKLPPGAGAEITNCGSVFSSSSSPFLFTTDLKKFYRKKIMVTEEVFENWFNFYPLI